ncbi:MAG: GlcNAc-transferase family protein [Acidobacteriaceae bacterium]
MIFVSIASYRDIQLVPTIEDLLAKAQEPGLVRFGICWQHSEDEPPLPFADDQRFKIIDVHWSDSRGACWARSEIMKLWQGEQWFLQIDSHCRFAQGWDTKLIRMMVQTGSPKPILSTYANAFTPRQAGSTGPEFLSGTPQLIALETFTDQGIPKLKPLEIVDASIRKQPMRARFLAAGFLFAPGSFVEDVPYDPGLYFFGEEISMTLRAFTAGYDLFHPVESVAWHDYVRAYAVRHWEDHAPSESSLIAKRTSAWSELDSVSQQKVRQLLRGNTSVDGADSPNLLGGFGLGTDRTREEYERYAGVSFEKQKLQDYTRYAYEPPNPNSSADWTDGIYNWLVRVAVNTAALPPYALDEHSFWVVAIQDEDRREIRRHDFQRKDLAVSDTDSQIVLIFEIQSGIVPAFWSILPLNRFGTGGVRLEGALAETDFSIITD